MIFSLQLWLVLSLFTPAALQDPQEPASPPPAAPKSAPSVSSAPAPASSSPASGAVRPRRTSDSDIDKEHHKSPSGSMSKRRGHGGSTMMKKNLKNRLRSRRS